MNINFNKSSENMNSHHKKSSSSSSNSSSYSNSSNDSSSSISKSAKKEKLSTVNLQNPPGLLPTLHASNPSIPSLPGTQPQIPMPPILGPPYNSSQPQIPIPGPSFNSSQVSLPIPSIPGPPLNSFISMPPIPGSPLNPSSQHQILIPPKIVSNNPNQQQILLSGSSNNSNQSSIPLPPIPETLSNLNQSLMPVLSNPESSLNIKQPDLALLSSQISNVSLNQPRIPLKPIHISSSSIGYPQPLIKQNPNIPLYKHHSVSGLNLDSNNSKIHDHDHEKKFSFPLPPLPYECSEFNTENNTKIVFPASDISESINQPQILLPQNSSINVNQNNNPFPPIPEAKPNFTQSYIQQKFNMHLDSMKNKNNMNPIQGFNLPKVNKGSNSSVSDSDSSDSFDSDSDADIAPASIPQIPSTDIPLPPIPVVSSGNNMPPPPNLDVNIQYKLPLKFNPPSLDFKPQLGVPQGPPIPNEVQLNFQNILPSGKINAPQVKPNKYSESSGNEIIVDSSSSSSENRKIPMIYQNEPRSNYDDNESKKFIDNSSNLNQDEQTRRFSSESYILNPNKYHFPKESLTYTYMINEVFKSYLNTIPKTSCFKKYICCCFFKGNNLNENQKNERFIIIALWRVKFATENQLHQNIFISYHEKFYGPISENNEETWLILGFSNNNIKSNELSQSGTLLIFLQMAFMYENCRNIIDMFITLVRSKNELPYLIVLMKLMAFSINLLNSKDLDEILFNNDDNNESGSVFRVIFEFQAGFVKYWSDIYEKKGDHNLATNESINQAKNNIGTMISIYKQNKI
ncbi:hypothetical protein SteCoe_12709 [Stentor coeruleus]|uniref:Uncharacterized protein n=1 Tax=Stentor coeruleus TaxID=5963 RepID=A0A1R2CA32_9CILI|nr:hypothetical protein SteCoe_12709 [Stentor coeruleus]